MKLSIIIPVYNTSEYLPACLDSVIGADYADYEIIVINDGSTDNSAQIAANYQLKYPELIQLISTIQVMDLILVLTQVITINTMNAYL